MKKIFLTLVAYAGIYAAYAQNPNWLARSVGDPGEAAVTRTVCLDNAGNSYAAGYFFGTPTFSGGGLTSAAGTEDIWVAKYNTAGTLQWKFKEGAGSGFDEATGIAVDPTQTYLYVTGRIDGNVTFTGTGGTPVAITGYGSQDIFLAKYLISNGNLVWAKNAGGAYPEMANAIAVASSGEIVITGFLRTDVNTYTINFPPLSSFTSQNNYLAFVARCSAAGTWTNVVTGGTLSGGTSAGYGITLDQSNNVYIVGDASLGSTWSGATVPTPPSQSGLFVSKVNSAFTGWSWVSVSTGTPSNVGGLSITNIGSNLYLSGIFQGTNLVIGSTTLPTYGDLDVLIASLSTSGSWGWAKNAGSNRRDYGWSITDNGADLFLAGQFADLAPGCIGNFGSIALTSDGLSDGFIAKMTTAGVFTCARAATGETTEAGYSVYASGKNLVWGGYFTSDDFTIAGNIYSAQNAATDAFVARYESASISPINPKICPGTSILLTASGGSGYNWSPPTGLSSTTGTSVLATPPVPITYTVTASSTYGCSSAASTSVGFYPAATANAGPNITINICAPPGSATIGTAALAGYSYLWNPPTNLSNSNIAQPTVTPTSAPAAYTYTVYAINQYGCTASDDVIVQTTCLYPRLAANEQHSTQNIYPNPGNGDIQLGSGFGSSECTVTDASGHVVKSIFLGEGDHRLNLTGFRPGVYTIKIRGSETSNTFKYLLLPGK